MVAGCFNTRNECEPDVFVAERRLRYRLVPRSHSGGCSIVAPRHPIAIAFPPGHECPGKFHAVAPRRPGTLRRLATSGLGLPNFRVAELAKSFDRNLTLRCDKALSDAAITRLRGDGPDRHLERLGNFAR